MKFRNSMISLGRGRFCSGVGQGRKLTLYVNEGSCIVAKGLDLNKRFVTLLTPRIVSLGSDCFRVKGGIMERRGDKLYFVED